MSAELRAVIVVDKCITNVEKRYITELERSNGEMQNGVVKWFDPVKGYGFITGDDGGDIFVHQSNILMKGFRFLDPGQRVSYRTETTKKGSMAINVVVTQ